MALARTLLLPALAAATSFKMDFLSSGTVRTDPLAFSQACCTDICNCRPVQHNPFRSYVDCRPVHFDIHSLFRRMQVNNF